MSLDQFLQECKNTSNVRNLKNNLSRYEETLERQHQNIDAALGFLDAKSHSLGYLYLLNAKISDNSKQLPLFVSQIQNFLFNFVPEQVKLNIPMVCKLSKYFTEYLVKINQEIKGIAPLKRAIAAICDKRSQLTPIHADILQLSILAKDYTSGLQLAEIEINEFNVELTQINVKEILCFFYYSGIIFATCKQYKKALEAFKFVFTSPATAISAIAIEAYKKHVLVHLIEYGTSPSFPRITPNIVQRNIKTHCKAYVDFSTTFISNNFVEIESKALANEETFKRDRNFGLVNLAIKSVIRRNIKKLTQTFMTLSISDIAEKVYLSPSKAEYYVLKMIEEKEIFASINQKDGMVAFHENPEDYNGANTFNKLDDGIKKIIQLENVIRAVDEQLTLSQPFLKRLINDNQRKNLMVFDGGVDPMDDN